MRCPRRGVRVVKQIAEVAAVIVGQTGGERFQLCGTDKTHAVRDFFNASDL